MVLLWAKIPDYDFCFEIRRRPLEFFLFSPVLLDNPRLCLLHLSWLKDECHAGGFKAGRKKKVALDDFVSL
jgi:hypothetical protein